MSIRQVPMCRAGLECLPVLFRGLSEERHRKHSAGCCPCGRGSADGVKIAVAGNNSSSETVSYRHGQRWGLGGAEQILEVRSLCHGHPRPWSTHRTGVDATFQLQGRCKRNGKWQNLRAQKTPAPETGVTPPGTGLKPGTPEPLCSQGLKGGRKRLDRGKASLGLGHIPGGRQF